VYIILTEDLICKKLMHFLRRAVRLGYSDDFRCQSDLLYQTNRKLFTVLSAYCMHQLLQPSNVSPVVVCCQCIWRTRRVSRADCRLLPYFVETFQFQQTTPLCRRLINAGRKTGLPRCVLQPKY